MTLPPHVRNWLALFNSPPLISSEKLAFSTSSSVYRLQWRDEKVAVLRVFDRPAVLKDDPDLPLHEACALQAAPPFSPRFMALETRDLGLGGPMILMECLPGEIEVNPQNLENYARELAFALAQIHAHRAPNGGWTYRSWVEKSSLQTPRWTKNSALWDEAFALYERAAPREEPVFLHRDFHPLNTLWQGEKLVGIVDWPNVCAGPCGVDIGHCRANLAQMFGLEAAENFRVEYQNATGKTYAPFWDIEAIFNFAFPHIEVYAPWIEAGLKLDVPTIQMRLEELLELAVAPAQR